MQQSEITIKKIIFQAIDEINLDLPKNKQVSKTETTQLFGSQSPLDSLELVNLIVSIEDKIDTEFDKTITIANEKAMSMKNSPLRDVKSLTEFILTLLDEE